MNIIVRDQNYSKAKKFIRKIATTTNEPDLQKTFVDLYFCLTKDNAATVYNDAINFYEDYEILDATRSYLLEKINLFLLYPEVHNKLFNMFHGLTIKNARDIYDNALEIVDSATKEHYRQINNIIILLLGVFFIGISIMYSTGFYFY